MNCVSVSAPVAVKQNNKTRNGCVGTVHITTYVRTYVATYVHTSSLYLAASVISIAKCTRRQISRSVTVTA